MEKLTIVIDFDNTIYEDYYPSVGPEIPGAIKAINDLYNAGHFIIIHTCREGESAEEAILAMERDGLKYHLFNEADPRRVEKYGYDARKIIGDIIIDDKGLPFALMGIDWSWIMELIQIYLEQKEDLQNP